MFGLPAAATKVGNQSSPETIPFSTLPAGTWPGQRTIAGTRKPPSRPVPLPPANGVCPPSGQVKFSAPLSVVNTTMVFSSSPLFFRYAITEPTISSSCAMPASWMLQPFSGVRIDSPGEADTQGRAQAFDQDPVRKAAFDLLGQSRGDLA